MEFWCVILGIILFIALFPYIRCYFKRLICMKKIKAVCRRKRYKLYATHPMWFLGGKYSKKCDVYIETANEIFAVKLFGVTRRRAILNFNENGQYFIKNFNKS